MVAIPQPPIWLQNGQYSARRDRAILDLLFDEGIFEANDFEVSQRAIGINNSVDVAAGRAIIDGDDEANQNEYLVVLEAPINVPFGPAPVSDARIDLVVLQVNDSTAGSTRTPADVAELKVLEGTPAVTPVAPTVPPTAIPLAEVLRTSGDIAIDNSMISDVRAPATAATYTVNSRFEALTTAQRDTLTPFIGQTIYNTDTNQIQTWNGSEWATAGVQAVTTAERDALTPFVGLTVYNTTLSQLQTYDGANWVSVGIFAVTTAERNALTPYAGLTVFNSDVSRIQVFDGAVWRDAGETFFAALTTAQRNALTPFAGQVIFNTDTNEVQVWTGSIWDVIGVAPPPDYDTIFRTVNHGSNAGTARISPAGAVYWLGSVPPDNAIDGDQWFDTSPVV